MVRPASRRDVLIVTARQRIDQPLRQVRLEPRLARCVIMLASPRTVFARPVDIRWNELRVALQRRPMPGPVLLVHGPVLPVLGAHARAQRRGLRRIIDI